MAKHNAQPDPAHPNSARRPDGEELPLWPHQVQGGKYVKLLQKFVRLLREEDGQSAHGNQALFLDDVLIAYLLALYNTSVRSLRTIEDFSRTKQAQRHLTVRKICKSTLSDFNALADPERLQPLVEHLRKAVEAKRENDSSSSSKKSHDKSLSELLEQTVAVDGTFLPALADVAWSVCNKNQHGSQSRRARVDVAAETIGQLYRHRWQVELFFRWLKSYGNFRHLVSQTKSGMQLNFYVAIIGIMLMYLHTGHRPSKYMFSLMGLVANGSATLEEIMPILRDRERQCTLARESQRRRNAKKNASKMKSVS